MKKLSHTETVQAETNETVAERLRAALPELTEPRGLIRPRRRYRAVGDFYSDNREFLPVSLFVPLIRLSGSFTPPLQRRS